MNKIYELYNEHAKTCDPADFWAQVKRSIRGRAVGDDQIAMIVAAVLDGLALDPSDVVLDLCCGNGILSDAVFERCRGGLGIDFAETLIAIAHANFQRLPERRYIVGDVVDYVRGSAGSPEFSKALCYGSFLYLSHADAAGVLTGVRERFPNVGTFFIGNLPDKSMMHEFYDPGTYVAGMEDDNETPLGVWRTADEMRALAATTGWKAEIRRMPPAFYAARYRYDAVLTRH